VVNARTKAPSQLAAHIQHCPRPYCACDYKANSEVILSVHHRSLSMSHDGTLVAGRLFHCAKGHNAHANDRASIAMSASRPLHPRKPTSAERVGKSKRTSRLDHLIDSENAKRGSVQIKSAGGNFVRDRNSTFAFGIFEPLCFSEMSQWQPIVLRVGMGMLARMP
jgi:hypothetical protein